MRVTVRVEFGSGSHAVVLRGREVQALEVRHAIGEHARCRLTFDRAAMEAAESEGSSGADAGAAPPKPVNIRALLDLPVRVLFVQQDAVPGTSGASSGSYVAFEGRISRVREVHRPNRGSRFVALARSTSAALGLQRRQRRYPASTIAQLAGALGVRAADLPAGAGDPLSYVQEGESDWAFVARLAAEEGLLLRPTWAWGGPDSDSGDGPPPPAAADADLPAEVRAGFASVTHPVTWGVDLLALATDARVAAPAVSGAHYDVDEKHDHRFRGVRARPTWTDGAASAVAAVESTTRGNGAGGQASAGDGPGLVAAGIRAPTLAAFRKRLERASERRVGTAVVVVGRSIAPGLVAGDRLRVQAPTGAAADAASDANPTDSSASEAGAGSTAADSGDGASSAAGATSPAWQLDAGGTAGLYGLIAVAHRWDGAQYENAFVATPWVGYHPAPPGADVLEHVAPSGRALGALLAATPALGRATGPATFGPGAGGSTFGSDGAHLLHGDDRAVRDAALLAAAAGEGDDAADADAPAGALAGAGIATGLAGGAGLRLALGVVADNADPNGQGRVRVRYLWQDGDERFGWARVASVMAGNQRGLGSLPEIGDEVVVGFLAGDPERPLVLGSLWNGKDQAAHTPNVRHWVTKAGNAVVLDDTSGTERVELHTPQGKTMVQLSSKGPTGVPLVTVYSAGDVSLEAPSGEVRITAKSMLVHTTADVAVEAKGALTQKAQGAITVMSGAGVGLKAGAELKVAAGGAITAHAGGAHVLAGTQVSMNPPGAAAPSVNAQVAAAAASAWGARAVPAPGPGRSTEDAKAPPARARTEPKDWIGFTVTDKQTGKPISDVALSYTASDGTMYDGTTDARGRMMVRGIEHGSGDLVAGAAPDDEDTDDPDAVAPPDGAGQNAPSPATS